MPTRVLRIDSPNYCCRLAVNMLVSQFGLKDNHIQWSDEERAKRSWRSERSGACADGDGKARRGSQEEARLAAASSQAIKRQNSPTQGDVKRLKKNSLFR